MPAVLYETDGPVAIVSLNRPAVLNAYNVAMRDALFAALTAVRDDPDIRVMILRGNGPAFSTGGDVREFGTAPSPTVARAVRFQRDVWGTLKSLPQITIAAVHGYAVGGGFEMAMLCDLCVAADNARFGLPETRLGMIPGVAGTQTTSRLFGLGRALDLVLTGRMLNATEAQHFGLVTRVVPTAELQSEASALAHRLSAIEPSLAARTKRAVHEGLDQSLRDGLALEARLAAVDSRWSDAPL
ncbi:MAG: enoyl-CoA hydratase/isomerase family protein [Deltaproteobacteria bacterium]|nr:enoyl-CoA hydratase/isomerase family protein [Deltaproteobacteria bacterium]MBI3391233.1 enoyl-CoA hydratase/isomerase family protein [Deltaproteobacteria bacterium]